MLAKHLNKQHLPHYYIRFIRTKSIRNIYLLTGTKYNI